MTVISSPKPPMLSVAESDVAFYALLESYLEELRKELAYLKERQRIALKCLDATKKLMRLIDSGTIQIEVIPDNDTIQPRKVSTGRPRKWDYKQIVTMYKSGQTAIEIARQLGCNRNTVYGALYREAP